MDAALEAAYRADAVTTFEAMEMVLRLADGGEEVIRLSTGGLVVLDGHVYRERHPEYGLIVNITQVRDGATGTAAAPAVTLSPETNAGQARLAANIAMGSTVALYAGVLHPVTGMAVGVEPFFFGRLDNSGLIVDEDSQLLNLRLYSEREFARRNSQHQRLCSAFLNQYDPAARGLEHVNAIDEKSYHRGDASQAATRIGGGGSGSSGGSGQNARAV